MTHYHIYIAAGSVIDETTRIYVVAVGTGVQANRDYLALVAHAVDNNHFFHIRDHETQEFMWKVMHSVSGHILSPMLVSAHSLRKSFASETDIPIACGTLHNQHRMRNLLDTQYRVACNLALRE